MRLTTMFLCEHAVIHDNALVSALNLGVTHLTRPIFPAPLGLTLVGIVDLPEDYAAGTHIPIEITVTSADEQEVFFRAGGGVAADPFPGTDPRTTTTPIHLDLSGVPLTRTGVYKVNAALGSDREVVNSIYFAVMSAPLGEEQDEQNEAVVQQDG